jgi:RNase adaptor protein for sRNA GlmZ degradation
MSVSKIVSIASSNVEFYNSIQNRDDYYQQIIDKSIVLSSDIIDNIQKILEIDFEIIAYNESLTSIEKNLKQLKKEFTYESQIQFIMVSHCIKINKQMKNEYIHKIQYLNNMKNEIYKELQVTEEFIEKPTFSINRTIMESNKLRAILLSENKKSYLMNMSDESRNKRKNNREMNKLLFQEKESPKKYNKIRKTKSPNNQLYN